MLSRLSKIACLLPLICCTLSIQNTAAQPCPTLNQTATLSSPDCASGVSPCTVCPGDQITLNASGTGLQPGTCVNWYYGTTNNFNPYNGEGTLLGCSPVQATPPNPCTGGCPLTLGLLVNACGTEENNELMAILSGGGFFVDDLSVDFDGSGGDIGSDCGWQEPEANAIASIQSFCPGATIVGAGPGEVVPGGVPVVIFPSAGYDFNYNFGGLCPISPVIYVMQSSCILGNEVFPQSGGSISTTVSVNCGCSDNTTYNTGSLVGGNGAFVTDAGFPPFYGNAGCGFPNFPGGGGGGGTPPIQVAAFTFTVTPDMCNGGPYFVTGIVEPLQAGCSEVFTNYMGFDVPCPMPLLDEADVCQNNGLFNLNQLVTPPGLAGIWSGPGVTGTNFNPAGQSGPVDLTFSPTGGCSVAAMTTLHVFAAPTATFNPIAPVCAGQSANMTINFTGEAPWNFNLIANGVPVGSFTADDTPFSISVTPNGPTNYILQNLTDLNCSGPNAFLSVSTLPSPTGVLSLAGPGAVCGGQPTQLSINFNNGTLPYTYQIAANGVAQSVQTAATDPFSFTVNPLVTTNYTLVLVGSSGCTNTGTGSANVTVTPAPTASIVTDTLPYCAGQTTTVAVTLGGPGPYTFFYTVNGVVQPAITVPDSVKNYVLTVLPLTDTTIIKLDSLNNGTCEGIVSGTLTLIAAQPPTAVLSGNASLCGPGTALLTINFTGTGPFIFNSTANNVALPTDTATTNPFTWNVPVNATTTFALTGVSANGCAGMASGQAVVNVEPAVSAVISGGGQTCTNGPDSIAVQVSFMGQGPFTFVMTVNNVQQAPVTTSANPYIFMVKPVIGTFYQLVSVSNPTCPGTVSGLATVFVFTPPTAAMFGDATFCDSASTQVTVDFTGTGPFSITWTQDGATQPPVTTFDDPYFIPVNTTTTTVFKLIDVQSPGCVGAPIGMATITIHYAPSFTNLKFNCNAVLNNYTVEFDVVGATTPLTQVSGNGGSFAGTHFTSVAIPSAQGYNFVFHDANNCGNVTVSGQAGCNCISDAGTMDLTLIELCSYETASATHQGDQTLDGNDGLRFVLHTNPATPLGAILAWNNTPSFVFAPPMQEGVTYYISAIAGDLLPDGTIDLNDPCLSVSQGTPVVFYAPPIAQMDTVAQICAGTSFDLPVTITGVAPFTLVYALDGVAQAPVTNILTSPFTLSLQPADTTVVSVVSIEDQRCMIAGNNTATILVNSAPQINNVQTVCDFNNNTYTVTFDVAGQSPFTVTGVAGFFFGNQFTSIPISSSTPAFSITLSDALNCGQAMYSATANCMCQTDAGSMAPSLAVACSGASVTAVHNGDQTVQANDIFHFVLHTNAGIPLGTVLATGATPTFAFMPGVTIPGTTYYVSAVAGNDDGAGNPDPNDPCYSISGSAPVMWSIPPTAAISGNFDICSGQAQDISVSFTGVAPFDFTYTANAQSNMGTSAQNSTLINTAVTTTTLFTLTAVQDSAGCAGTLSGQAGITVHPTPDVVNFDLTCSPDNSSYTIEFDVINADLPLVNISLQPGSFNTTTGHYVSGPIPIPDPYVVIVTDNWLCGRDSVGGMPVCNCITDAGVMDQTPQTLCYGLDFISTPAMGSVLENNDTLLYFLVTNPNPADWQILDTSDTPSFSFNSSLITANTTYYIVAAAGDATASGIDLNDPCLSLSTGGSVLWHPNVTGSLNGFEQICAGDTTLFAAHFTGGAPYQLVYAANNINQTPQMALGNTFSIQVIPLNTVTYTLVSVTSTFGCVGTVTGSATVEVIQAPQVLDVTQVCDYQNQTYVVQFQIGNGAVANPVYTVSGLNGTLTDTSFTSVVLPADQDFSFTVTNPTGCSTTYSGQSVCLCTTNAGTLVQTPVNACVGNTLTIPTNGNPVLDPNDVLVYVLCEDPALLPDGIIGVHATPEFSFQSNMEPDTTYYVVATAGNPGPDGLVDLSDPCSSVSAPVPVTFHAQPQATLAGDTTVCGGGGAIFQIQFLGVAPFSFVFANNGVNQSQISAPQNSLNLTSNNIQAPQIFTLVSLHDAWCPGIVTGQATVDVVKPTAVLSGDQTVCPGESATLALNVEGSTFYNIVIGGGSAPIVLNNVQNDTTLDVSVAASTTFTLTNVNSIVPNCPGQTSGSASITIDMLGINALLSDHNGFNVSCPNGDDGAVTVTANGGVPPFTALWSTGETTLNLDQLAPGDYQVTLTDNEGCTALDSFTLSSPPELFIEASGQSPRCYGDRDGQLTVAGISGNLGPFEIGLNGHFVGATDIFPFLIENLPSGPYELAATDVNGCTSTLDIVVPAAEELLLDLGPDTTIHFGDSLLLVGQTNALSVDSVLWLPNTGLSHPELLSTWTKPEQTIRYQLFMIDSNGCTAQDQILVRVNKKGRVYIPSVIVPGSKSNSILAVFGGPEVSNVNFLRVYDRWGECVYEGRDLRPNISSDGWDGRWRGKDLPPAVYIYVAEVAYLDGTTELFKGDVTVLR